MLCTQCHQSSCYMSNGVCQSNIRRNLNHWKSIIIKISTSKDNVLYFKCEIFQRANVIEIIVMTRFERVGRHTTITTTERMTYKIDDLIDMRYESSCEDGVGWCGPIPKIIPTKKMKMSPSDFKTERLTGDIEKYGFICQTL